MVIVMNSYTLFRLLVGAPKARLLANQSKTDSSSQAYGDVFSCELTSANNAECLSVRPPRFEKQHITEKESMGLAAASVLGSDNVTVSFYRVNCYSIHFRTCN